MLALLISMKYPKTLLNLTLSEETPRAPALAGFDGGDVTLAAARQVAQLVKLGVETVTYRLGSPAVAGGSSAMAPEMSERMSSNSSRFSASV